MSNAPIEIFQHFQTQLDTPQWIRATIRQDTPPTPTKGFNQASLGFH